MVRDASLEEFCEWAKSFVPRPNQRDGRGDRLRKRLQHIHPGSYGISQLSNLETLDVSNNQLESLPEELTQLSKLETIYLHGNEPLGIPPELLRLTGFQVGHRREWAAKPSAILHYYFRRQKGPTGCLNEAKILWGGEGGSSGT
jgi:hypothetical protein